MKLTVEILWALLFVEYNSAIPLHYYWSTPLGGFEQKRNVYMYIYVLLQEQRIQI